MASQRAPKQWTLTKHETITTFESWRHNLQYILSLDQNFAPFLVDGFTFLKKSPTNALRGLTADDETVPEAKRRTAEQKVTHLELMLGQIANYCPIISRNSIVKNSTSLQSIWHAIRQHYGFQLSGAHFLDFNDIKLEPDERPEDLYQRLVSFVEDNLLKSDGSIEHNGEIPTEDEELSPTLENLIVLTWLRLIHPSLPALVRQRYGTELRTKTIASIKPEISLAMESLLEEIQALNDSKVMRTAYQKLSNKRTSPVCPLCKQAGRQSQHFLSKCRYLPESDKQYLSKVRQTTDEDETFHCPSVDGDLNEHVEPHTLRVSPASRRVSTKKSPTMKAFFKHHPLTVTLDTGAELSMIKHSVAQGIGATIKPTTQNAIQADGSTPLKILGETHITLTRGSHNLLLDALVVDNLDVEILAGIPFMVHNDIAIRPSRHELTIGDSDIVSYASHGTDHSGSSSRQAFVLRISSPTVVWPGEYVEVDVPSNINKDATLAIEKRYDCQQPISEWPSPQIVEAIDGKVRILNNSQEPQKLAKHGHLCQAHFTSAIPYTVPNGPTVSPTTTLPPKTYRPGSQTVHADAVDLDPHNILSPKSRDDFRILHSKYDRVFSPDISKGYNGAVGPFQAKVNMGPVQPPQRKGRVPQYNRDKLVQLQDKIDELESQGVLRRPEDVGISVEYLNPSFLVKKPNGGHRLVTDFADVGRYSKPQPSLMPDVDSTLRTIAPWKYIIKSDLTSAFYQIPLSKDSMKYCGVVTPFKGVRVYTRSAMGMPGSETALEELMCRVLGDCIQDGIVAKLADDLYCGGDTPDELYANWKRILEALDKSNLRLSPTKTVVAPTSTTILGWTWSNGSIAANSHRISVLASCSRPTTVHGLRSFIGAYKVLSRVLPNCSSVLAPLDDAIAGLQSQDKIDWNDSLNSHFTNAQSHLSTNKSIALPRPSDQLWIITDGSVVKRGIGATLYVTRGSKLRLAGFFSAKLRKHQVTWLPCEIEALSIAAAIKHFSPYIIQSNHRSCILSDSKPCVQAVAKLYRGEFSSSPRLTSFLSLVSRYNLTIKHLAGSANVPSDFASRNAPDCTEPHCQVCSFITETEDSVVRSVQINDVINNIAKLPFASRSTWSSIQAECPDLRRTHAHLKQGTRPSKKLTNVKDIKRYLNVVSIARDNLLVVQRVDPLIPYNELIVVPRSVIDGLVTALHMKLNHPTRHQMKLVLKRQFYALDMDNAIDRICDTCHVCASLKTCSGPAREQSTGPPPEVVGISFAADVMKQNKQLILVLRETVSSYTAACIIANEKSDTLRDALLKLILGLHPLDGPCATVRCDAAPGFVALRDDQILKSFNVVLEIGQVKNINKNPVAEKSVLEVENELLRYEPAGGAVSELGLCIVIAKLNSRIRNSGMSSRELWTQRSQYTNEQLPISDREVILNQHESRLRNHPLSEKSKNKAETPNQPPDISVGDIVYLASEKRKLKCRDRYLVVVVEKPWCHIKKFTGSQLRATSYKVKINECYRVPIQVCADARDNKRVDEDGYGEIEVIDQHREQEASVPPDIHVPDILSYPAHEPWEHGQDVISSDVTESQSSDMNLTDTDDVVCNPDVTDRPRRSVKRPSYLKDYVVEIS